MVNPDWIDAVQRSQYHGCWRPGFLCRQNNGTRDIDYVE